MTRHLNSIGRTTIGRLLGMALWAAIAVSVVTSSPVSAAESAKPKSAGAKPITLPIAVREKIRSVIVQHKGRYKPLDTLARELTNSITGTESFRDQHHVDFLLQCTVQQAEMERTPLFRISRAELRKHLELEASPSTNNRYSFYKLIHHQPLRDHAQRIHLKKQKGKALDDLDKKLEKLENRLNDFHAIVWGHRILLIPNPDQPHAAWHSTDWLNKTTDERYTNVKKAWQEFAGTLRAKKMEDLYSKTDALTLQLGDLPAKFRPKRDRVEQELHYNDFAPFNKSWKLMILGAVIALAALFIKKRWCDLVTTLFMFGGFGLATYGIYLRWQIAGRIPASNMYESLLFMSWGAALFTIIGPVLLKNRAVTLNSAVTAGIALMLADVLPIAPYIKPVAPVLLDTFWMAVHVPVIMVSYSVLAIAVVVAHVQVIGKGLMGTRWKHTGATDTILYWYIISGSLLLLVGILTGSMWAAFSWGRYWGWDPKEVWSLVAFLGYMAILHTRISKEKVSLPMKLVSLVMIVVVLVICIRHLDVSGTAKEIAIVVGTFIGTAVAIVYFLLANSRFATAAKSIIAFWLIIMTYVGVNYVLGTGLHSYGFGAGNVASKTMLVGGIDLMILGICALMYYVRNGTKSSELTRN